MLKKSITYIFIVINCCLSNYNPVYSQQIKNGEIGASEYGKILFKSITINDGLADNDVVDVYSDEHGFIWIGTRNGLERFDGLEIKHYKHIPGDSSSLSNNRVLSMYINEQNELWVHTYDEIINKYIPQLDNFVHHSLDDIPEEVKSRLEERRSILGRKKTSLRDVRGHRWTLENGEMTIQYTLPEESALSPTIPVFNQTGLGAIHIDKHNVLWLATINGGVKRAILERKKFKHIFAGAGKNSNSPKYVIRSMATDNDGLIWIGTQKNGLYRYNPLNKEYESFNTTSNRSAILNRHIRELYIDSSGILWIGTTREGGLTRFDQSKDEFTHYQAGDSGASLPNDRVHAIREDSLKNLWIGTFAGLSVLKRKSNEFIHHVYDEQNTSGISHQRVRKIFIDHKGTFWICTERGLNRVIMEKAGDYENIRFETYTREKYYDRGLINDFIFSICETKPGTLWLGTAMGLIKMDVEKKSFQYYGIEEGLADIMIFEVQVDDNGNLWMCHNQGISKLNVAENHFTNYTPGDGIRSNLFIQDASLKDSNGNIYFAGNKGITYFNPDEIKSNPYPPKVAITTLKVLNKDVAVGQEVEGAIILDKNITETKEITFHPSHKTFTLEFVALHYLAPKKNQYAYKLQGYDKEWNYRDASKRYATYSNLPGGDYTFLLKAANSDGLWMDSPLKLNIHVIPPFWQTWWFRVLAIILVVALVLLVFHVRTWNIRMRNIILSKEVKQRTLIQSELEKKNAELERFTYTVSHDLKSPLITIKGFLGLLKEDIEQNDKEGIQNDLRTINKASDQMQHLLDDLLEISRIGRIVNNMEPLKANEIVEDALALFKKRITDQGIQVEIEQDLPTIIVDKVRMMEVFQNLIGNAIKFMGNSKEKRINIGISQIDDGPAFFVRDTGSGIKPEFGEKVFELFERLQPNIEGTGIGLAIVKRIIEVHNGKIWVESEGEGKGSTFFFILGEVGQLDDKPVD